MRLSLRDANVQGRLSKSPTQLDWSVLSSSADSWPPLLPSFSKETVEALDRFVQGFICKRIEYRCGQLSATQYLASFLPQWTAMAEQRTDLMEEFFAQHGTRLDEDTFQRVFGAFERLQSALRDARQERGNDDHHDKKITFARPVAHRLIRRSRDRFSLRSVADADESVERSSIRLSGSPHLLDMSDVLRSSLQRASLSPVPYDGLFSAEDGVDGERTIVLPVEEHPEEEEHFTGRASGVYYGDVLHAARGSTEGYTGSAGPSSALPVLSEIPEEPADVVEQGVVFSNGDWAAGRWHAMAGISRGATSRSTAWRRYWICLFYYLLIPSLAVWIFCGNWLRAGYAMWGR